MVIDYMVGPVFLGIGVSDQEPLVGVKATVHYSTDSSGIIKFDANRGRMKQKRTLGGGRW